MNKEFKDWFWHGDLSSTRWGRYGVTFVVTMGLVLIADLATSPAVIVAPIGLLLAFVWLQSAKLQNEVNCLKRRLAALESNQKDAEPRPACDVANRAAQEG